MGAGAIIEPLVVVILLFGGAYVNRNTTYTLFPKTSFDRWSHEDNDASRDRSPVDTASRGHNEEALLDEIRRSFPADRDAKWRKRVVGLFGWKMEVSSPDTRVFRNRFRSRLLLKLPFLVEVWYWALIYWVRSHRFL
jgi:hypothetical protein